jgi:hypothetical protein
VRKRERRWENEGVDSADERVFLPAQVGEGDRDGLCIGETKSKVSWI